MGVPPPESGAQNSDLMSLIHEAGFSGEGADIMYAIVMAESGGHAHDLNNNPSTGDLSYGLAQINMIGSMGPQRLAQYGLKSYDDLYDPLTNLKVAYKLSNGGTKWSDWSTYNSGAYQQYLGQTGAKVSLTGSGSATADTAVSGTGGSLTAAQYEQALGSLSGILDSVPQLKALLDKAISEKQPTEDFLNAVQNSEWYRTHSASFRQMYSLQYSDPAEYQNQYNAELRKVETMANSMGVRLSGKTLGDLTHNTLFIGWDDATLQQAIAKNYVVGGVDSGQAASTTEQLKAMAESYGMGVTNTWLQKYTQGILSGEQTADGAKADLIAQASSLYPSLSKELQAGKTVADVAQPYIAQMSQTLEIPDQNISVKDATIQKALRYSQPPTSGSQSGTDQAPMTMPLWQFENNLRQDPRWDQTNGAKQEAYSMLHTLGQQFGFAS